MTGLCAFTQACLNGEEVFYPGSSFFIDPDGMNTWQLFFAFCVYGYVLFVSADMIGDGAELLLLVPGYADMVGSIVLPILGAIPDGMMVLFSGVGPLAVAQENVAVGVGALAGSTIMLLTLPWILSVYAAQVDMDDQGNCIGYSKPAKQRFTKECKEHGCRFGDGVTKNAWLMLLTSLSYFVIQIPAYMVDNQKSKAELGKDFLAEVIKESKFENTWAGVGFIVTIIMFFFYLYLQYLAATKKSPPLNCLKAWLPAEPKNLNMDHVKAFGVLALVDHYRENFKKTGRMRGDTDVEMAYESFLGAKLPTDLTFALKSLFNEYAAKTADKSLHHSDLRSVFGDMGISYGQVEFLKKFEQADKDKGGSLDQKEFLSFFYDAVTGDDPLPHQAAAVSSPSTDNATDEEDEEDEDMPEEFRDLPPAEQRKSIMQASCKQMLIGTFLVLIFSDPMVDVLSQIGKMTGIPAFYVSFVLAPLASNASELMSSYKLAARKTSPCVTQSLQTLEGAACMNNTFCLGIFFFLIYYQGLAWRFTAETLSIFLVQFLVFLIVIKNNTQTMTSGIIIFLMYPVSLVLVAALESFGLD